MSKMSVKDIVREWLEEKGYDGLYDAGECACLADDLAPCEIDGGIPSRCQPGFKVDGCEPWCGNDCDWHVGIPLKSGGDHYAQ